MPKRIGTMRISLSELVKIMRLPTGIEITRIETGQYVGMCEMTLVGNRLPGNCEFNEGAVPTPLLPRWRKDQPLVFDGWTI
jgi:hypothetical protein